MRTPFAYAKVTANNEEGEMGKAKDEMMDRYERSAVAAALDIRPEDLDGFSYEVVEDTDRAGNVIRTFIR